MRLTKPMRRTGAKGTGSFAPITWDDALDEVAERLRRITVGGGAHRVLTTHYSGTLSLIA